MQSLFFEFVSLVLIILALAMVAHKLRLAYPVVLGGRMSTICCVSIPESRSRS